MKVNRFPFLAGVCEHSALKKALAGGAICCCCFKVKFKFIYSVEAGGTGGSGLGGKKRVAFDVGG